MMIVVKPEKFNELASNLRQIDQEIIEANAKRKAMNEQIAYLFTEWRSGDWLTLRVNGKEERHLIVQMELYSERYLKEPIYDEQFLVKVSTLKAHKIKKDSFPTDLFLSILLFPDGKIADEGIELISHKSGESNE